MEGVSPEQGDEQGELYPRHRQCPHFGSSRTFISSSGTLVSVTSALLLVTLSREHHCLLVASWPPCVDRGHGRSRLYGSPLLRTCPAPDGAQGFIPGPGTCRASGLLDGRAGRGGLGAGGWTWTEGWGPCSPPSAVLQGRWALGVFSC